MRRGAADRWRLAPCGGGDFVSQSGTRWAGRLGGGGYHFRRRAVFPCVECASDWLQSGKACRVTRVGPRKPACLLNLGCGRPLKGRRGIPWRIHRQCSSPGKPCPLSVHRRLGERAGTNCWSLLLPSQPPRPAKLPAPSPVLPVSSSTVPPATPPARPARPNPTFTRSRSPNFLTGGGNCATALTSLTWSLSAPVATARPPPPIPRTPVPPSPP